MYGLVPRLLGSLYETVEMKYKNLARAPNSKLDARWPRFLRALLLPCI